MEITELMKSRRTVHQYKSEKVPEKLILGALEVALWAPNHRLTFPWRFVLVGDQARAKIADLASALKAQKKGLSQVEAAALRATYMNPSHLIVLAQKECPVILYDPAAANSHTPLAINPLARGRSPHSGAVVGLWPIPSGWVPCEDEGVSHVPSFRRRWYIFRR